MLANQSNILAGETRGEIDAGYKESKINDYDKLLKQSNFEYAAGASKQVANKEARALNIQSAAAKDNIMTTGLGQLQTAGMDMAKYKNKRVMDDEKMKWLNQAYPNYQMKNGQIMFVGNTKDYNADEHNKLKKLTS